jgi:hypothetical protein
LKDSFCNYIAALRDCPVPHKYHEAFVQSVLGLRSHDPFSPNTRDNDDWDALSTHIANLCSRYAAELGENAYAIFNAVTEFASNPPAHRLVCRERHSFQRSAGEWVSSFSKECAQSTFNLAAYLSRLSTPRQAETVN